ncbi:hypothetical protein HYFRA_00006831 [Hymenoscyphus fraxineus]|uniref:Homeobox domain-containing protein n=1 Tax=Hymenoscyphus fraxineus TaxID=746836 RepID=A0A9N9KPE3_9HELO|nr:hypothetical protein HYFRA_00006831 [Hymenoscyphus fraxineus]
MSDATLPPPRSSPRPEIEAKDHVEQDTVRTSSVHRSSSVMGDGAEVSAENRTGSKQRRKRTRPEDQAILEAEYKRNPKPNKAARADIVEKVTLNEKEVQIWFQNRRQINRRKSRPLLPHEIAAFGLGGMTALSSDPISASCSSSQGASDRASSPRQEEPTNSQEGFTSPQEKEEFLDPRNDEESARAIIEKEQPILEKEDSTIPIATPITERCEDSVVATSSTNSSFSEYVSKSFSSTPGYLSNRWNSVHVGNSFSAPSSAQATKITTPQSTAVTQPNSCPERVGGLQTSARPTRVRLSMSLDGKAELITTDASPSPSPPRRISPRPSSPSTFTQQKRARTLQRSQSALPLSFPPRDFPSAATSAQLPPRLPTGSSRDSRIWEFRRNLGVRDELTAQAENESNGSALAAISLLRQTSNSALKTNNNKRNAPPSKRDIGTPGKKPKLGRAASSLARLQTPGKVSQDTVLKPKDGGGLMRSPSGDSDKENWTPIENGVNPRRRPLPSGKPTKSSVPRTVLGDNHTVPTHAVDFGAANKRRRRAKDVAAEVFEDQPIAVPAPGDEVTKFMQSGEISPSKKGDLDCVQGLLSLSQGNWR